MTDWAVTNHQPVLTKTPDGRVSMAENGCRTADVAIELLREVVERHNLLVDLYEWSDLAVLPEDCPDWETLHDRVRESIGRSTP